MRRAPRLIQIPFLVAFLLSIVPEQLGQVSDAWQPVPKEDLTLKDNPANPGSSAMILERQIYTDDEKRFQTEWVRIKIFNEEGRAYADIEIPYFAKVSTVENIRGRTVRSDGTVIIFNGAVFDKVVAKYRRLRYEAKTFTLPGVEIGSVIEYAYTVRWKESLPDYVRHPQGYLFREAWTIPTATWTIQQALFTRHAVFVLRPVKEGRLGSAYVRLPGGGPSWQPDGTKRMEVHNVAAIEQEDYMPPESMLNSRVHFYYMVGYVDANWWNEFGKLQAQKAEKFTEKTPFLERAANEIAPKSDPPEVRLRKLYTRVQQIRYLSYEPSKTEKEVKREHLPENKSAEDIYRHGYGSGKPDVLDASQLNAIVVLVRLKNENLYFDPASRFCPYGLLPWFESATKGVLWDKSGGAVLDVHAPANESSVIERTAELKLQPDGSLDGELDVVFTGQEALDRRLSASDEDETGRRKLLEDEIKALTPPGAKIDVDSVAGWQDLEQPLRVRCRFHASRFAVLTHQRMLFPMAVFQANRRSMLTHSKRMQPVYFRHGYSEVDKITISLPAGYRVEALSPDVNLKTTFATYQAKRTGEAGVVRLERHAVISQYSFPPESYGSLRQYLDQVRQSDAENVVLHGMEAAQAH